MRTPMQSPSNFLARVSAVTAERAERLMRAPLRAAAFAAPATASVWDATSLRTLLSSTLAGQQIIAVSNRQPHAHCRVDGRLQMTQAASGLVTAVEPVMRACGGTWIAHGDGPADREVVDAGDCWHSDAATGSYRLRRVWLSDAERRGHGDGFSNTGLWPLCHMAHMRPRFDEADWGRYREVNQRFADAVVQEARPPDPIVMVHHPVGAYRTDGAVPMA